MRGTQRDSIPLGQGKKAFLGLHRVVDRDLLGRWVLVRSRTKRAANVRHCTFVDGGPPLGLDAARSHSGGDWRSEGWGWIRDS